MYGDRIVIMYDYGEEDGVGGAGNRRACRQDSTEFYFMGNKR